MTKEKVHETVCGVIKVLFVQIREENWGNNQSNTFDFRTEIHTQDIQIKNQDWQPFKAVDHMIKHAKTETKHFNDCVFVLCTYEVTDSLLSIQF